MNPLMVEFLIHFEWENNESIFNLVSYTKKFLEKYIFPNCVNQKNVKVMEFYSHLKINRENGEQCKTVCFDFTEFLRKNAQRKEQKSLAGDENFVKLQWSYGIVTCTYDTGCIDSNCFFSIWYFSYMACSNIQFLSIFVIYRHETIVQIL